MLAAAITPAAASFSNADSLLGASRLMQNTPAAPSDVPANGSSNPFIVSPIMTVSSLQSLYRMKKRRHR